LTRTRWIQYGVLLAVAFVLSVGAGALIGRSRTGAPVAVVPTPTPAATATLTPSVAPATPTIAPTATPSHAPPTNPPTPPPTLPPTAPPVLDPPTAEEFAGDLLAAFQSDDKQYLFERLHPLVAERYGERQCRRYVNDLPPDPDASWTVLSSTGPAPWDWVTDDLTTTVDGTWTVAIEIPDEGQREVHFTPSEGTWRWFLDCGDPR
jgi:hypothetical protein